jgi:hypothetical protein
VRAYSAVRLPQQQCQGVPRERKQQPASATVGNRRSKNANRTPGYSYLSYRLPIPPCDLRIIRRRGSRGEVSTLDFLGDGARKKLGEDPRTTSSSSLVPSSYCSKGRSPPFPTFLLGFASHWTRKVWRASPNLLFDCGISQSRLAASWM